MRDVVFIFRTVLYQKVDTQTFFEPNTNGAYSGTVAILKVKS